MIPGSNMKGTKKYWKGLEQLTDNAEFKKHADKEFPEYLPIAGEEGPNRRDFLKLMGFSVAAATLAACETPVKKAIPYINKPATVDPSVPNYFASTYSSGSDAMPILVKTREGRPIKIEGNKLSGISGGGTNAQMQASVLSLYDKERLAGPTISGSASTWEEVDKAIIKDLAAAGGKLAIVSNSIASPSTLSAIEKFKSAFPADHITYDPMSLSGLTAAYEKSFGKKMLPFHEFSKAKTIVSFGADFLGSWPNNTYNNKAFASTRKLSDAKKEMSRLYAFESNLSLTGANADYRQPIKPSEEGIYIASLYNMLASRLGGSSVSAPKTDNPILLKAATDLINNQGQSVVISGSNDSVIQTVVLAINELLKNHGATIDVTKSINTRKGDDQQFENFVKALNAGQVAGVIFINCNPVYDHPLGAQIQAGLGKVKLSIATSDRSDETSSLVKYQAPDHHFLEAWNDFEVVSGNYSLSQPTIKNIFDTRQVQQSMLSWSGDSQNYYDFILKYWEENIYPLSSGFSDFTKFWDQSLHDGVFETSIEPETPQASIDLSSISISAKSEGLELVLYENNGIGSGTQANNPWLQEMPDPITKAVWDNYLTVSPKQAEEWGIELGDMVTQKVNLTVGGVTVEVPVMPQPGQAYNTVGLALGYGRTKAGKVANNIGVNAFPLAVAKSGSVSFSVTKGVSVEPLGTSYQIAQTQTHDTYMGRETVIQDAILSEYKQDSQAGRSFPKISKANGEKVKPYAVSLWQGHEYPNHHWGLMIDLNSCTGCGACTIACQAENNIPVVGKSEVLNRREMHWIRIDRYYSSDAADGDYSAMEKAAENPEVTFQPMMCQQCNNAPCETVCPVAATTHSSEGLNQMTYNRCIGTRYCANNCPYKVRRFNWFKYHDNEQFGDNTSMNNDLGKMVLNPDVTVRARGVMEKCTFCVQRIQSGKLTAKREGRRPEDGDVSTACASACPAEALVFGDMKDPSSNISQKLKLEVKEKMVEAKEPRAYHVLEELRVMPNVWYLTKVRNKDEEVKTEKAEA